MFHTYTTLYISSPLLQNKTLCRRLPLLVRKIEPLINISSLEIAVSSCRSDSQKQQTLDWMFHQTLHFIPDWPSMFHLTLDFIFSEAFSGTQDELDKFRESLDAIADLVEDAEQKQEPTLAENTQRFAFRSGSNMAGLISKINCFSIGPFASLLLPILENVDKRNAGKESGASA
ncbi:hypothetical protein M5689_002939 [Euphorbia peplus]|nr:hypothetical protein M5689_002939 [Euphorbia peplus]